jgi:hypothetical protein
MDPWIWAAGGAALTGAAGSVAAGRVLARRGLRRWLFPYLLSSGRRQPPRPGERVHLLLCIADHYEPKLGGAPPDQAAARVRRWVEEYPKQFAEFRDADGRPPRHSFFYPAEEYEPGYLDALAALCARGFGEVDIHLHHDNDSADNLRRTLINFKLQLADRHGLLARERATGDVRYAFIHGNWALDNARQDGRWCGVDNELEVLCETGCYVDMTLPSAPDESQTRKINSIYYAEGRPGRRKSHDTGTDVGRGPIPPRGLMLIQGPLTLDWSRRKFGLIPRVENACLQGNQPPGERRLANWLRARIQVPTRPDWFFVKLHTHGANERNTPVLLGEPMVNFHRHLRARAEVDPSFRYHYVTAREMYNLVRAAEQGWAGSVADARDLVLAPGPAMSLGRSPS